VTQDPEGNGAEANVDSGVSDGDTSKSLLAEIEQLTDEADKQEAMYLRQVASPDYASRLKAAAERLLEQPLDFNTGDLVTWKAGLRNRYYPANDAPAVVVGTAPGRVSDERNPGSVLFDEPLDLQLGIIDADGDFIAFYYDRRRFTHWPPRSSEASASD
jgi:hypothetical protein